MYVERRTALCSVRGALQLLHNAANLVKFVDVDAESMLRTAKGLPRSSVTRVEFVNRASVAANSSAETEGGAVPMWCGAFCHAIESGEKVQEEEGCSRGDGRGREQRWRPGTSLGWWC